MLSYLFGTTSLTYLFTATAFTGSFRNDYVFSSFRNDTISTGDGNDYVDSGAGNDVVSLGNGNDIAFAGSGNDTVDGGAGNDDIYGGDGNDILDGGLGNDLIDGGAGNDIIRAGAGTDTVFGGSGNDTVIYTVDAALGRDRVNGGQGFDLLVLELTAAQQASAAFMADRAAFNAYLAAGGNGTFQFQSIGLTVTGGFEQLRIDTVGGPAVNTAPVVSGPVALAAGTEDTALVITAASLLANATDAEGNPLSVTNLQASSGTITSNGNGTFTYTPVANANGPMTFSYSVSDGALSTAATATVNIAAVNDGPVAGAPVVLAAAAEDTSVMITAAQLLANASDIDSATLSVTNLVSSSGTLVNTGNGTWTFTPAANDDTGVTFTYQISDGQASVAGSASLDLTAVNDGPVAGAPVVLAAAAEDTTVTITAAQLLANASDIDSATLSVTNLASSSGTLVNNGNGTWSFTPAANDDTGVTFTYQISDGQASVAGSASLDLTAVNDGPVAGAPVVLAPLAEDTSVTITAAQLLANASDIDSATLSVVGLTSSSGALVNNGNGTWSFTPAANDDTGVTFTYQISDGQASVAGSASLDLTAVNDGPVAGAPVVLAAVAEDTSVTITAAQLLANASDIDSATLSVVGLASSSGALVNNGNGTWSFTPAANDDTSVNFTYQISDGQASVAGSASIDLTPVNDAPVAGAPIALPALAEDTSVTITAAQLLANASDIDSATLSVTNLVSSSGTLVNNGNGTWTFTPAANDDTSVNFTYQISDGQASVASSASLDLTPVNDLPDIEENSDLNISIFNNQTGSGQVIASDVETPQDELTYELYYGNEVYALGFVQLNADGSYTYYPPTNEETEIGFSDFVGQDSFQVIVRDGDGGSTIVTVNINVEADPSYRNFIYGNGNDEEFPLEGTDARDVFVFENVNQFEITSGSDVITNFTQGQDLIRLIGESNSVDDILAGVTTEAGTGNFVYSISPTGAQIATATMLTVADFERDIRGTSDDDMLVGSSGVDTLTGYEGSDDLTGGLGADRFQFYVDQQGDDTITDFVSGVDKVVIHSDASDISADAFIASGVANGDGTTTYAIGPDTSITVNTPLAATDIDFVFDGAGPIVITGSEGADSNLNGSLFSDEIFGLGGNDTIFGLSGNDVIRGGLGNDTMTGGTGSDTFVVSSGGGNDVVTDFDILQDYVALDAPTNAANFLESVVAANGSFTYSLGDGTTLTTNVQLQDYNVYNLFPV